MAEGNGRMKSFISIIEIQALGYTLPHPDPSPQNNEVLTEKDNLPFYINTLPFRALKKILLVVWFDDFRHTVDVSEIPNQPLVVCIERTKSRSWDFKFLPTNQLNRLTSPGFDLDLDIEHGSHGSKDQPSGGTRLFHVVKPQRRRELRCWTEDSAYGCVVLFFKDVPWVVFMIIYDLYI